MSKRKRTKILSVSESEVPTQRSIPRVIAQGIECGFRRAGEACRKLGLTLIDCSLQPLESGLELPAMRVCKAGEAWQRLAVSPM